MTKLLASLTYNQVALTLIYIANHPDLGDVIQESEVVNDLLFSSGASASAATVTQAGDGEIEFELLDKPHQPRSGQEFSLRGN